MPRHCPLSRILWSVAILTTFDLSAMSTMVYDGNAVVLCIKRHYELMVKAAYFDFAEIRYPPGKGWSDEQIAVDIIRACGRSEEVIDLLRHLSHNKKLFDKLLITRP